MGRGRQKAKQTKVARDLKYYSPPTDLSALQRELQGKSARSDDQWSESSSDDDWDSDDFSKWDDQDDWDGADADEDATR